MLRYAVLEYSLAAHKMVFAHIGIVDISLTTNLLQQDLLMFWSRVTTKFI
jgi:hypothetical protein